VVAGEGERNCATLPEVSMKGTPSPATAGSAGEGAGG
jgi:hypothetical protein